MKDLAQRTATAAVFAVVMIGTILFIPEGFAVLFFIIGLIGLREFYTLNALTGAQPDRLSGMLLYTLASLLFILAVRDALPFRLMILTVPVVMLVFISELYRKHEKPFLNIAVTLAGVLYIWMPVAFSCWIAFGFTPDDEILYHGRVVMGVMFLVWASDTGAYFIGSKFGRNRLFERISPKKSWEGFFGGLATSVLVAWILSGFYTELSDIQWMVTACIVTVTGTLGDLVESMLKRSAGVKDSGTILPGHGGILDRFDAFFVALPFAFTYFYLLGLFDPAL